jgi:hypothetical protein
VIAARLMAPSLLLVIPAKAGIHFDFTDHSKQDGFRLSPEWRSLGGKVANSMCIHARE